MFNSPELHETSFNPLNLPNPLKTSESFSWTKSQKLSETLEYPRSFYNALKCLEIFHKFSYDSKKLSFSRPPREPLSSSWESFAAPVSWSQPKRHETWLNPSESSWNTLRLIWNRIDSQKILANPRKPLWNRSKTLWRLPKLSEAFWNHLKLPESN